MLLLRLCLVLAILAGIGVIVVSQAVLKPQIQGIIETRDTNKKNWDKAEADKRKLNKDLGEAQTKLKKTESELETTKTALANVTAELDKEREKSKSLAMTIEKLKSELKGMNDKLAAWEALGYSVDQINGLIKQVKDFKVANEGLMEENKLLAKRVKELKDQLAIFTADKEADPPVPAKARGRVLVVDPKWDFLVLDVGSKLDLPDKGVLLVSRNGTLIAKIRVMNVQPDRSIANIMPGWKLKDVMEGDLVFPYAPTNTQ